MRRRATVLGALEFLTALALVHFPASAQVFPICSWPLETTGSGITNVAYPDTNATYWTMPFDSSRWKSIVIKGTYPQARFFSFVSYISTGSVVAGSGSVNDTGIQPDAGSTNPFQRGTDGDGPHFYTITAAQSAPAGEETNFLQLGNTKLVWIIYRIYVPNSGLDREAGVPLPSITVTDQDNRSHTVRACPSRKDSDGLTGLRTSLLQQGYSAEAATLANLENSVAPGSSKASCQPTPLVSWIPKNTGGYFPNPANKYIAIPGLCFEPDRILVVRGKGPVFPDTFNGGPIWEPAGVQMRYWSMCNNDQHTPYPVVACAADHKTALDEQGFYTYVLSEPGSRSNPTKPSWVPSDATWLPLGPRELVNILLLRNMLPQSSFGHSVQDAIQAQCVVDNQPGTAPTRNDIVKQGACAHKVMGDYYPTAVYCQKQVFINEGWQGCFAAASRAGQ